MPRPVRCCRLCRRPSAGQISTTHLLYQDLPLSPDAKAHIIPEAGHWSRGRLQAQRHHIAHGSVACRQDKKSRDSSGRVSKKSPRMKRLHVRAAAAWERDGELRAVLSSLRVDRQQGHTRVGSSAHSVNQTATCPSAPAGGSGRQKDTTGDLRGLVCQVSAKSSEGMVSGSCGKEKG